MRNKTVAALLAFFLGIFGVHRFYLGKRAQGILHLILFFFTLMITVEEDAPLVMVPAILGFIDFVLLAVMPTTEFDRKYNREYVGASGVPSAIPQAQGIRSSAARPTVLHYKAEGVRLFREHCYADALEAFLDALELAPADPSIHFNLACCYAELDEAPLAYEHLELAFAHGFDQPERVNTHPSLTNLRQRNDFAAFVANGYRMKPGALPPAPAPDLLASVPTSPTAAEAPPSPDLLEQIAQLGELRESGILTDEEFTEQKRRILERL